MILLTAYIVNMNENELWIMKLEGYGTKRLWTNLKY
jgi:hypothetical protein